MGMLKKAENKMAFAKIGIYGNAGSGKTYTAAKIAIGLHKMSGATKPVGMFDTEPAASFIIPLFKAAGVDFLVYDESRALKDLMAFMDEAEKDCSVVIIDSITHVWRDAQESFLSKINNARKNTGKKPLAALEFQHWRPIKAAWADFTDRFLSSKIHVIVCGRAGQVYEYQEKDDGTGKKELISTGTRMATEKELGYEPSLLVEMIADRDDGKIVNIALVQKDRADVLNGKELRAPTFESFKPHFEFLNIGGEHHGSMQERNSADMFEETGDDNWSAEQRRRTVWAEEIQGLLMKHFPGQTAEAKGQKADLIERFFQTRSWTKVENTPSDQLKNGFEEMKAFLESAASPEEQPAQPDQKEAA